jgi:hypothetical protein
MTSLRFARHLLLTLAALSAMLLGACHDNGLIDPPDNNDECCARLVVAVNAGNANAPIEGVEVALRKGSTTEVVQTKVTDANGIASFGDVCNGEYNLRLVKDGYNVSERGNIAIDGCDTTEVSVPMLTRAIEPGDTCCDSWLRIIPTGENGGPLAGAQVRLTGANGFTRTLESTLDGATFRELCRGEYGIRIQRDGYKVKETSVEIGCGVEKIERIALVREGGDPTDTCCLARLMIGARDASSDEFLNGATVKLWRGGAIVRTLTMVGRPVIFENLCEGSYGYSIHKEGYRPVEGDARVSCNSIEEIWREMQADGSGGDCCNNPALIRLLDSESRQPVANANVKLLLANGTALTSRSNGDGVARFEKLCVGQYVLVAEREGYRPLEMRMGVTCGEMSEVTGVMVRTGEPGDTCCNATLRLRVIEEAPGTNAGIPVMGAHVIIKKGNQVISQGVTDREGYYSRGELCGFTEYGIVIEKDGYQRRALEFNIRECRAYQETIRIERE